MPPTSTDAAPNPLNLHLGSIAFGTMASLLRRLRLHDIELPIYGDQPQDGDFD